MTPQSILSELWGDGISLRLAADGANLAAPAGRLSGDQRALVLANKAELVTFLRDAHDTTTALLTAAMRACDQHGDGPAARNQMRTDCLATPAHLLADLLAHFNQTYGSASDMSHLSTPPRCGASGRQAGNRPPHGTGHLAASAEPTDQGVNHDQGRQAIGPGAG